ncbi:hypothetical protein [Mesorhizobium sp. M0204]|uniref:hypothetical protein n=1 Tax=unclassified Mesorhizobium TaxID=325217 RepID=UPI00333B6937
MLNRATFLSSVFLMVTPYAHAQNPSYCSVALTEKAYDKISSNINSTLAFSTRDDLCSREYSNVGEAQSTARNSGFSLGYKLLSIDALDAKQSSTGRWNISETTFCKSTASDLKSAFSGDYESVVASIAVKSWLECVRQSSENALYIEYTVSKDGQDFAGTLRVTANTGSLNRQITGISVVGRAKNSVKCNIGGIVYEPGDPPSNPINVETAGTAIACEKAGDEGVRIALQTSGGSTPFITLPSVSDLKFSESEKLMQETVRIGEAVVRTEIRIQSLEGFTTSLSKIQLYKCPKATNHYAPGGWATFGCVGQISSENICTSYTYVSGRGHVADEKPCAPITLMSQ